MDKVLDPWRYRLFNMAAKQRLSKQQPDQSVGGGWGFGKRYDAAVFSAGYPETTRGIEPYNPDRGQRPRLQGTAQGDAWRTGSGRWIRYVRSTKGRG